MFRYREYNRTIVIAVIIILLCLVSIVGLTLALFTNDIEDGTIGINVTAGKLKVDIVDTTEEHNSLVGGYFRFITQDGTEEMHKVLFEPGAFYYTEGFQIENEGNIDMKYIVYISTQNLQPDVNFSDAFEVWITTERPTDRSSPDPKQIIELQDFEGELKPKAFSDTYYLVVKMKESADNRFNKNREYAGIAITVCAVQGNGELTVPTETTN